jgi:hypothetical protein
VKLAKMLFNWQHFQFLFVFASALNIVGAFTTPSPISHPYKTATRTNSFWKIKQDVFYNTNNNQNSMATSHAARRHHGSNMASFGTVEWSDLLYDDTSLAFSAWEWTNG